MPLRAVLTLRHRTHQDVVEIATHLHLRMVRTVDLSRLPTDELERLDESLVEGVSERRRGRGCRVSQPRVETVTDVR